VMSHYCFSVWPVASIFSFFPIFRPPVFRDGHPPLSLLFVMPMHKHKPCLVSPSPAVSGPWAPHPPPLISFALLFGRLTTLLAGRRPSSFAFFPIEPQLGPVFLVFGFFPFCLPPFYERRRPFCLFLCIFGLIFCDMFPPGRRGPSLPACPFPLSPPRQ